MRNGNYPAPKGQSVMKIKTLTNLVIGIALSALAPTSWAGGRGGGGFHGGGFGGGARSFGGGARFSARGFTASPITTSQNRTTTAPFRSAGFRPPMVTRGTQTGTNLRSVAGARLRQNSTVSVAASRRTTPPTQLRAGVRQRIPGSTASNSAVAQPNRTAARQFGLNGRTDHIADRHNANWRGNWDHRRAYYENNRWYAFNGYYWVGLDEGYYPWDYYPYYTYDYYPYDYYVGAPENVPADYQGTSTAAPAPDATVQSVQTELTQFGYYNGPIDGLFGPTTRDALARYQASRGLTVTGSLSPDTLQSLGFPSQTGAS
jgi:hypothetical protein